MLSVLVLAYTEDENERQEYIKIIENNNTLLLQLIGDILDLSKIEAGVFEFVYSKVNLNVLLMEVIRALCEGMDDLPQADGALRRELMRQLETEGVEALAERLKRLDPVYYGEVDLRNPERVLRAVEVCLQTGRPFSSQRTGLRKQRPFDIVKIGVTLPREELYARIDRRVDAMLEAGLEEEARRMLPYRSLNALQTVGYREFFDYFDGTVTRDEAITLIKRNSRRYAKRQLTWFRRDAEIRWFSPFDTEGVIAWIDAQSGAGEY